MTISTPTAPSELASAWSTWHQAREADLATEHGWLSLIGFYWLPENPSALGDLPGSWSTGDGQAVLSAVAVDNLVVMSGNDAGLPIEGTVTATVPEAGSLQWIRAGDTVIELVLRGGRYAIRLRDPQGPERVAFTGVPAFEVDPDWIRPGRYTPYPEPQRITVETARDDLRQHVTAVGTVSVEIGGLHFELVATAGQAGQLQLAFRDATNGPQTAPWRVVDTSVATETGYLVVDFNRTVNLPFSFTEFGLCPAPVAGNELPVAVTAGELAPIRVTP